MPVVRDDVRKKRRTDKTRTGCVICKREFVLHWHAGPIDANPSTGRRVKCGEEKPTCRRCIVGRWPCRYELTVVQEAPSTAASTTASDSRSSISDDELRILATGPNALSNFKGKDLRGFKFFLEFVAPCLDVRSSDVWSKIIPQAATNYPSIQHALVAMSGFQEQFYARNQQLDPGKIRINRKQQESLLLSYNRAIRDLLDTNVQQVPAIPRLICCLLFIVIELIQGRLSSVKNLSGLARRMIFAARRMCATASERTVLTALQSPFRRLELAIWAVCEDELEADRAMYTSSTRERPKESEIPYHISWASEPAPKEFRTVSGAYESITSIVHTWLDKRSRGVKDEEFATSLQDWYQRFETINIDQSSRNCLEIYYQRCKGHIALDTSDAADWIDIVSSEAFLPEYTKLVDLAEQINPGNAGCFVGSYTSNLWDIAIECKDPIIRRRAIAVIEKSGRQTGLLRSDWMAKIAMRVVDLEEKGRDVKSMRDISRDDWIEDVRLDWKDADGPLTVRYRLKNKTVSEILE